MKILAAFLTGFVWLGTLSAAAQDATPSANQDSGQSVADADKANPAPKVDPAKEADIRRLLELSGGGKIGIQSMRTMEKSMRPLITNALPPGEYRAKLVDLFFEKFDSKIDPSLLVNTIVPIYDKNLSDDDIKQLIQVYQTPIGQKLITVMPKILAESQAAGEKWGEQLGRQSMLDVLAEHPELEKAMEEARKSQ